jgi:hypothetical protein
MKNKTKNNNAIMKIKLLLAGIVAVGMMASCANDEAVQTKKAEPTTITIALKGNSETTKTAADSTTNDAKINNLVVGLFDAGGNLVSLSTPTFTAAGADVTATVTGTTLVTKIAVVANAPSSLFSSAKTLTQFNAVAIDLGYTATSDASVIGTSQQYISALPMEGENSVDATVTNPSATVTISRLVSRIELASIKVAFDANGAYSSSTFVPTDIFMYNAAETAYADYASPYVTGPTFLQGENGVTGVTSYLGTGALSLTQATSYPTAYTFFTMPIIPSKNSNTKTKLIIKGTFTDNSNATSTVYYPIIINHVMAGTYSDAGTTAYTQQGGEDGLIAPNTYYKLMATIKTKGVSHVTDELTSAAITLTVKVNPWPVALIQNVVFN